MKTRPPALATWLLAHLTCGTRSESLVGDLVERYQEKQSDGWFWRQTVVAVAASVAAEGARQAPIALSVAAIAVALPSVYVHWLSHPVNLVYALWYPWFLERLARSVPDIVWRTTIQLHPWAWTGTVAWCALLAATTRAMVRARPRHRALILTVFVASNLVECAPQLAASLIKWLQAPADPAWAFNLLWYALFVLVAGPLSILSGGRARRESFHIQR